MHFDSRPIGVYDSGIGGFTVLNLLRKRFPNERFIYYADNIHLPYGNKSPDQVLAYSKNIINWMESHHHVKMVIAACNTSSALALPEIKDLAIPVIGTIKPTVGAISHLYPDSRIGIIATLATSNSRLFESSFQKAGFKNDVISIGCPDFVPIIESGAKDKNLLMKKIQEYVMPLVQAKVDKIIYGCTHYPLIEHEIREFVPKHIDLINPAQYIADKMKSELHRAESSEVMFPISFYGSDNLASLNKQINKFVASSNYNLNYANPHLS